MTSTPHTVRQGGGISCPHCGLSLTRVGAFWICPEHGQTSDGVEACEDAATASAPVAAFISYGHADSSEFVRRLKADLEVHGIAPVWLDAEMLGGGDLWTVGIEHGIRDADVLLAVMSRHSLRENSVCHDEVALASTENKRVIPVRIESDPDMRPSLLLVRRSWVDFTGGYEKGLSRLLAALGGDVNGLVHPLRSVAGQRPLDSSREIARHARSFLGRGWLLRELDDWLAADTGRAFLIVGEPGIGKSAIAAHFAQREDAAAVHFCSTSDGDTLAPLAFVANLVTALGARVPAFGAEVAYRRPEEPREDAKAAFRQLLVEPAHAIEAPPAPQLVIVDALDEAATREGETIVELIASHAAALPSWLRLVATSRPEAAVTQRLKALHPRELSALRPENLEDLTAYLTARLSQNQELPGEERQRIARALADKAGGNFLYAKLTCDSLLEGELRAVQVEALPAGLDAVYAEAFARAFPDARAYLRSQAPVLRALAAAFAPLPFPLLRAASGQEASLLNLTLGELRSYLKVAGRGEEASYALFHRSLSEWLCDRDLAGAFWCDPAAGHAQLAAALDGDPAGNQYAVRWLPHHLAALERWPELAALLSGSAFIAAALDHDRFEMRRLWTELAKSGFSAADAYAPLVDEGEVPVTLLLLLGSLLHNLGALKLALRAYERGAEVARSEGDAASLARALGKQALIHRRRGEFDVAMALLLEQEQLCRELSDQTGLALSLGDQALILRRRGKLDDAMALCEEMEGICLKLGDVGGLSRSLGNKALILMERDELERAMTLLAEQERICRELSDPAGLQASLGDQARVFSERGERETAMALLTEQERICRELGDPAGLEASVGDQAECLLALERPLDALPLIEESVALARRLGSPSLAGRLALLDEAKERALEAEDAPAT